MVVLFASTAQATVLTFDEGTQGDLPDTGTIAPLGALGIGVNTIAGSMLLPASPSLGGAIDVDRFVVTVPLGMQLNSVTFNQLPGTFVCPYSSCSMSWGISAWTPAFPTGGNGIYLGLSFPQVLSGSSSAFFSSSLPLGAGDYWFSILSWLNGGTFASGTAMNYRFDLTAGAAPVPLPASAWLLVSGLLGFVALGRKRARSVNQAIASLV
jgi:hypothetical protein